MQEWVSVTNKLEGVAQISFQIHKKMFVVDTQEYFCDWHTACVTQEFLGGEDNLNFIFAFAF